MTIANKELRSASGSRAEDLFIELFSEAFGAEKAGCLYSQYPFYDIYQNSRYADFVLASGAKREVSAQLLDELEPGDYVMVHAGVAIAKITQSEDDEAENVMENII